KSEQPGTERDGEDVGEIGSSHADRHEGAEARALACELLERRMILDPLRVHCCSSLLLEPLRRRSRLLRPFRPSRPPACDGFLPKPVLPGWRSALACMSRDGGHA